MLFSFFPWPGLFFCVSHFFFFFFSLLVSVSTKPIILSIRDTLKVYLSTKRLVPKCWEISSTRTALFLGVNYGNKTAVDTPFVKGTLNKWALKLFVSDLGPSIKIYFKDRLKEN
ncbi:hypothetical protein BDF20DRAFT_831133 [Mycotypha africana]|uniref:uncharacterized protein n=1 Tax=Mycotypha africana TaxID=64632 RepID=UPI0023002BA3|nr:uncharacterized protein BDF20DRAFT_831133 [Mycotypha africana]KAI8991049.1 hypothetical protein BDF20DRAFT_831133 [Mycotypha africana]